MERHITFVPYTISPPLRYTPGSLVTEPLPFFTSTTQVASFPSGPSFTLKANTPPIFLTSCSPSCSESRRGLSWHKVVVDNTTWKHRARTTRESPNHVRSWEMWPALATTNQTEVSCSCSEPQIKIIHKWATQLLFNITLASAEREWELDIQEWVEFKTIIRIYAPHVLPLEGSRPLQQLYGTLYNWHNYCKAALVCTNTRSISHHPMQVITDNLEKSHTQVVLRMSM